MSRRDHWNDLRQHTPVILPSMLLCDFGNLEAEVRQLEEAGAHSLHLDVMDGRFVPNLTYGMPIVEAVRRITDLPLDVHLMIEQPDRYLQAFAAAGADAITIHQEASGNPRESLRVIRQLDCIAGLAINPDTPLSRIESLIDECDLVLIMSVNAGFGGQAFQASTLEKVRCLRQIGPADLWLEMDGGINADTIGSCAAAGADLLVVGSAIFRQPAYGPAIRQLREAATGAWADS